MKILFVVSYSGNSGANHSFVTMIEELRKKGIDPIILIPKSGPLEDKLREKNLKYYKIRYFNWVESISNVKSLKYVIKWKIKRFMNILQEVNICKIIKSEDIKLVHINSSTINMASSSALRMKIPIVWHVREFLEEDLGKTFWDHKKSISTLSRSNKVIAISKSVKNKYIELLGKDKILKIYNGVDINEYEKYSVLPNLKGKITLTIAGRIVKQKGFKEAIYAVNNLISEGYNLKLQIVGDEGDELYKKELKSIVSQLDLADRVIFLGFRNDMPNIWKNTDIALVCSKAEAFGRVTVEAMLSNSYVVGSNSMGTAELLDDELGSLYETDDVEDLTKELRSILEDEDKLIKTIRTAKKVALSLYTAENNAEKVFEVYKQVLDGVDGECIDV